MGGLPEGSGEETSELSPIPSPWGSNNPFLGGINTNYVPLSRGKPNTNVPQKSYASIIFWKAGLDPKPGFIQVFHPKRHRSVLTQPPKLLSPTYSKGCLSLKVSYNSMENTQSVSIVYFNFSDKLPCLDYIYHYYILILYFKIIYILIYYS